MNAPTTIQGEATKPEQPAARKRIPSRLDPFTEQLLQMEGEGKPLREIVDWLKAREIETSANNVSKFLIKRRTWRQLDKEKNLMKAFEEWKAENPDATAEMVSERFQMLALGLSLTQELKPETLMLADRLAWTASRVENDRSRADYRKRKLVMEEAKHAEWVKCEQTRALEFCLNEAKKYPTVADMFRGAFNALEEAKAQPTRRAGGPCRTGHHPESTTAMAE